MTRQLILLYVFLIAFRANSQTFTVDSATVPEVSYLKGADGFILGTHVIGKTITGEIGYIRSNVTRIRDYPIAVRDSFPKSHFFLTSPYSAISAGSEFFINGNGNIGIGPKIGFDYGFFFIFHGRINMTYYSDFGKTKDLRISPAVGLSLGFVNLMYNFNFPLLKTRFDNIATNRISLVFFVSKKE